MKRRNNNPLQRFAKDLPEGQLEWIGLRPARKEPMQAVPQVEAIALRGLAGDHRIDKTPGSGRQVTLISKEFIEQIALYLGRASVEPSLLRRNLVISGINLNALRYQRFLIGDAEFEAGALCHPCSRMETALGKGGVAAMLGHGGLCCEVLRGGCIRTGDPVRVSTSHETGDLFDPA